MRSLVISHIKARKMRRDGLRKGHIIGRVIYLFVCKIIKILLLKTVYLFPIGEYYKFNNRSKI